MPILFEDETFRVEQPLFGGWKITHKPNGATLKPNTDQIVRIGLLWKALRSSEFRPSWPPGTLVEDMMFFNFAQAVYHSDSRLAIAFLGMPVRTYASELVREANEYHALKMQGLTSHF